MDIVISAVFDAVPVPDGVWVADEVIAEVTLAVFVLEWVTRGLNVRDPVAVRDAAADDDAVTDLAADDVDVLDEVAVLVV